MKRFLITCARAPVSLELARNLAKHGHQVFMTDSLRYPLAKNSRSLTQFIQSPSPRNNIEHYQTALLDIIQTHEIDYLLPMCEESFYISKIKDKLTAHCEVLCPDFELMQQLHSKYDILSLCQNTGISLPKTEQLDFSSAIATEMLSNCIVKREFCRFGTDVLLSPTPKSVQHLFDTGYGRILKQEKIQGNEYCTYAIAVQGKVFAQAIYQPTHRLKVAAGIYFKPIVNQKISDFIQAFCQKHQYTGHLGFDIIETPDDIYIIECNPRATSGLHLLEDANLADALLGVSTQHLPHFQQPKMISLMMVLAGLPFAIRQRKVKAWYRDYQQATDVMTCKNDNGFSWFQFISLAELAQIAFKEKISVREAATQDFEWDGEAIK
ncbi:ATP-grasp domain-containing protein [uncultured Shewanella sp.]|uniref:ATP-grasp domain-containing protein n=1 Tax=uncultured Shewanella sp. TaxID=173975 RepID=UPI0026364A9B|nr:ATP-grasp domain-containing protein [uncultured Shewanella sp.]